MIFSMATIFVANAQTSDSPWAVSLGANLVNVQDDSVDASTGFGVPSLSSVQIHCRWIFYWCSIQHEFLGN